jgi:signal transduction histidine kinase
MLLSLAIAVLTLAALPANVAVGHYTYGFDNDRDYLGWAIVSHDNTSMSGLDDLDSVESLKTDFGEEFLYIRLGRDRYVIRDRSLIARAEDAAKPMQEAGKEVGKIARAQAEQALGDSYVSRHQARLMRRQGRLSGQIARRASRGESTEDLERELEQVTRELDGFTADDRNERMTRREENDLSARQHAATERIQKSARRLNQEMRDILREAKARHVAERVPEP